LINEKTFEVRRFVDAGLLAPLAWFAHHLLRDVEVLLVVESWVIMPSDLDKGTVAWSASESLSEP
jgi:hypothetical protein